MDRTASFYSQPSYRLSGGGGFPIFAGSRRQRGGSLLGSLKSVVVPALKSTGKAVAKTALNEAIGLAKDVAADAFTGKNIKQSLLRHGKQHAINFAKQSARHGMRALGKAGTSSRKRPAKMKKTNKAKRRRVGRKLF